MYDVYSRVGVHDINDNISTYKEMTHAKNVATITLSCWVKGALHTQDIVVI